MNEKEFQQYHKKPTPTIKKALRIASQLFCTSICTDACKTPCNIHQQSYTLLPEIANRPNQNFYHNPLPENNPIVAIQEPPKPPKRMQKLQDYPITTITNTKQSKENLHLVKLKCSHRTNVCGHNPKTKIIQCGWPPTKYSHTTNHTSPTTI
jgi:hypothetical protein